MRARPQWPELALRKATRIIHTTKGCTQLISGGSRQKVHKLPIYCKISYFWVEEPHPPTEKLLSLLPLRGPSSNPNPDLNANPNPNPNAPTGTQTSATFSCARKASRRSAQVDSRARRHALPLGCVVPARCLPACCIACPGAHDSSRLRARPRTTRLRARLVSGPGPGRGGKSHRSLCRCRASLIL